MVTVTVLLDPDTQPTDRRADALQDSSRREVPQRAALPGEGPVRHRNELVDLGPGVWVRRSAGTPVPVARTRRHLRLEPVESVVIGLQRPGHSAPTLDEAARATRHHDLGRVDSTRPSGPEELDLTSRDDLILTIRQVGVPVEVVRAAAPAVSTSPVYPLLRGHVAGLFDATVALGSQPRLLAGQATAALVRALLLSAARHVRAKEALEETLELRIVGYLRSHLGERDLTVERVAAAHHVSTRHLYNVWARAGHALTPSEWIIDQRLRWACDQLADPDQANASIESIARRCGFADVSHFSRRFRLTFQQSPSAWRRRHQPAGVEGAAAPH
jgi:AraC family transcriptional activator of tynA and feaB